MGVLCANIQKKTRDILFECFYRGKNGTYYFITSSYLGCWFHWLKMVDSDYYMAISLKGKLKSFDDS